MNYIHTAAISSYSWCEAQMAYGCGPVSKSYKHRQQNNIILLPDWSAFKKMMVSENLEGSWAIYQNLLASIRKQLTFNCFLANVAMIVKAWIN